MKNSGRCIKCTSKRLWIVDKVSQPDAGYDWLTHVMTVTSHRHEVALRSGELRVSPGSFQVIICAACGGMSRIL
jgi:hypothetical protein